MRAGIPKGHGHVEVLRAGVLDDVAPLIGAALDESELSEAVEAEARPQPVPKDHPGTTEGIPEHAREQLESIGLLKPREIPIDPQYKREIFAALGVAHTFTEDEPLQVLIWEKLADLAKRNPGQYRQLYTLWESERGPPLPF